MQKTDISAFVCRRAYDQSQKLISLMSSDSGCVRFPSTEIGTIQGCCTSHDFFLHFLFFPSQIRDCKCQKKLVEATSREARSWMPMWLCHSAGQELSASDGSRPGEREEKGAAVFGSLWLPALALLPATSLGVWVRWCSCLAWHHEISCPLHTAM